MLKNPKNIMVLTKKEYKVRPECSICILHVLNFLFPDLFAKRIVEILKVYIKKKHV